MFIFLKLLFYYLILFFIQLRKFATIQIIKTLSIYYFRTSLFHYFVVKHSYFNILKLYQFLSCIIRTICMFSIFCIILVFYLSIYINLLSGFRCPVQTKICLFVRMFFPPFQFICSFVRMYVPPPKFICSFVRSFIYVRPTL